MNSGLCRMATKQLGGKIKIPVLCLAEGEREGRGRPISEPIWLQPQLAARAQHRADGQPCRASHGDSTAWRAALSRNESLRAYRSLWSSRGRFSPLLGRN